jgi:quercetin dioxygenase-like cupin family protein
MSQMKELSPTLVTKDATPWTELGPGIEVRMLTTYNDGAGYVALFRFAPGTRLPTHHHLGRVHAYTLQGSWRYLEYDWAAEAGSYAEEKPGHVHTFEVPADAAEPAVVLFVSESGMVLLNEGMPQMIVDTKAMMDLYRASLAARGESFPEVLT